METHMYILKRLLIHSYKNTVDGRYDIREHIEKKTDTGNILIEIEINNYLK